MLIKFSVENWMSFRDPVCFSMVATSEKQRGEHVPRLDKYSTRVLPVAAIFGGNAAGKTNLFKALNFVQRLVVKGTQPDGLIPIDPYFDLKVADQPTHFEIELLVDETIYEYGFAVTRDRVVEEKLVKVLSTSEKVLYHRQAGEPNFDKSLTRDEAIKYVFKGTRDNQLFLTNAVFQRVEIFKPIYSWFKDCLELIAPDSRFASFEQFLDDDNPLYQSMNSLLARLDTVISRLGGGQISFANLPWPDSVKMQLQEDLKEGQSARLMGGPANDRVVVTRKTGELIAKKLFAYHQKLDGTMAKFEMSQESDGTQRIIDLLPVFLKLSASTAKKVIMIDEVDRSLHTLVTRTLIHAFLSGCTSKSRSQLLFTTHDVLLLDQSLLRRDEIWVCERDLNGASALIPFSDFKDVRHDKDIRKSYLQGRMGGVPQIHPIYDYIDNATDKLDNAKDKRASG
jgi:AAA15 family ATPase/GTPase